MKYSILHPSRGRPEKSKQTIHKWLNSASDINQIELIVSCDLDDPKLSAYEDIYAHTIFKENPVVANQNRSAVDAINYAASISKGEILIVVSDDTDVFPGWDKAILKEVQGKSDWLLKTEDGIQDYICTFPIMDRIYFNRTGCIYHPGYRHLFADTYLTCVADINGRKITSNLLFQHKHYSNSGGKEGPDELHKRNDATWSQGEELFIKLISQYSIEDRRKISDPGMKNWLRRKGVQI